MTTVTVPSSIKLKQLGQWELKTTTTSGQMGLDGRKQRISRENRTWVCSYQVLDAWGYRAGWGAYLAFLDELHGAANTFNVSVPNINQLLPTAAENLFLFDGSGNMGFQTGTNNAIVFDSDPNPEVSADAAAGAKIIQTTDTDGEVIEVSCYFSHNDFLYRVSANNSGALSFNPPLRTAIATGQTLQVLDPKIRVRLPDDNAAAAAHQFNAWGAPYILTLEEAFER
jgi:hypothetical protein